MKRKPFVTAVAVLSVLLASAVDGQPAAAPNEATTILAGGCYWGVEAVFEHVRGVKSVTSGFARYADPSSVPVEAVRIVYDPNQVPYRRLLEVFFFVAHDPTSRDRQGPDAGPEYRAAVLYQSPSEKSAVESFVAEITRDKRFGRPIVTEIRPLTGFREVGPDQQDYGAKHPTDPYIVQVDAPKLDHLQKTFPALYQAQRAP